MPASSPPKTSRDRLAEARIRFLQAEDVDSGTVRKPILASWWRSRQWHVAADHVDLDYLHEPDLETRLARSAAPVLNKLHEELSGQPISVILTDADGLVLARMTGDRDLERALDGIKLAPGFSYAEDRVGTNGIGTALEAARPTCSGTSTTQSPSTASAALGCPSTTRCRARQSA
jgi:transcriptional regulator of acetoin/glycerol metabolism